MNLSELIRYEIKILQDEEKAGWVENYVKHGTKSWGVGIPKIRKIIQNTERKFSISEMPLSKQKKMLDELMKSVFTESKLAAILYIQLYWKKMSPTQLLPIISKWFNNKWIFDWNICDWLCVRLLTPLINTHPDHTVRELKRWSVDQYLWKSRASLVPFAQCKNITDHKSTIALFSERLIKRDERFAKTTVGWVLREYSKSDPDFVISFLNDHENWATKEVTKNATKYLKPQS